MTESSVRQRLYAVSGDTESAIRLLEHLVHRLVASATPAVAFSALAEACASLLGPRCIVDLVEDSGALYSIERPLSAARDDRVGPRASAALPGNCRGAGSYTVSAAATVPSSSLAAAGGSGYYVQVITFCAPGHRPTAEQEFLLQHLVDSAVDLVRRERIQAALDAEHAQSAQLRHALESSRHIGIAIGITMNASGLTSAQAFDVLSKMSQDTNRKLRDVAADVVRTGGISHADSRPDHAVHAAGTDDP